VRQLDSGYASLIAKEPGDSRELLDVLVLINPQILRADASLGRHRRRFREYERRSADSAAAKMHEMPIVSETIHTRILAHGRNYNAIPQSQLANC
jgi:hypothetical protein